MRGGKREGAGRKALRPEEKRQKVIIYVSPETASRIDLMRSNGANVGRYLDNWIATIFKDLQE